MTLNFAVNVATSVLATAALVDYSSLSGADHGSQGPLSLADLSGYSSALAGKPVIGEDESNIPPTRVRFRDICNRPDMFLGRCVIVEGRVERIFRQGPLGTFPALAEVWLISRTGDPFCTVFPQHEPVSRSVSNPGTITPPFRPLSIEDPRRAISVPEVGKTVRFTGSFLKMVAYKAADGNRLAPLIVGNRLPVAMLISGSPARMRCPPFGAASCFDVVGGRCSSARLEAWVWSPTSWVLGLALGGVTAGLIAWKHLYQPSGAGRARYNHIIKIT
jgi:hypothetical protein